MRGNGAECRCCVVRVCMRVCGEEINGPTGGNWEKDNMEVRVLQILKRYGERKASKEAEMRHRSKVMSGINNRLFPPTHTNALHSTVHRLHRPHSASPTENNAGTFMLRTRRRWRLARLN